LKNYFLRRQPVALDHDFRIDRASSLGMPHQSRELASEKAAKFAAFRKANGQQGKWGAVNTSSRK